MFLFFETNDINRALKYLEIETWFAAAKTRRSLSSVKKAEAPLWLVRKDLKMITEPCELYLWQVIFIKVIFWVN